MSIHHYPTPDETTMRTTSGIDAEEMIRIFDTTLRDGEQAPGCTLTRSEKLEVARQLARLGVDVVESGFPAASPGDWDAVHTIAGEIGTTDGPIVCGLARANRRDIERCAAAIEPAVRRRIHTFLATSDIHLEHKLRMSRARAADTVAEMVSYARSLCDDVEFSPEDATRSDRRFLFGILQLAIEAGATTLNIPDTVGYATPEEYGDLIRAIRAQVPGADGVTISTHCHDDLGLATANSLAGVRAGARQVECTINGIGERAGNAALEETVMALHTRRPLFALRTRVNTREIARASRLVAARTGVPVPANKAIVGENAFAHEAGIHQDGVLKRRETYEIMAAEAVGHDGNRLVLGKHSGRHALRARLEALGYDLDEEEVQHVFARFKELADKKKMVDDRDLEALVTADRHRPPVTYFELDDVRVGCGNHIVPTATVRLRDGDGAVRMASAQGTGPVDAVCQAMSRITGEPVELLSLRVNALTEGGNAAGEVMVRIREEHPDSQADGVATHDLDAPEGVHAGYAMNVDIVVAAAEAYLAALNRMLASRAAREATPASRVPTWTPEPLPLAGWRARA